MTFELWNHRISELAQKYEVAAHYKELRYIFLYDQYEKLRALNTPAAMEDKFYSEMRAFAVVNGRAPDDLEKKLIFFRTFNLPVSRSMIRSELGLNIYQVGADFESLRHIFDGRAEDSIRNSMMEFSKRKSFLRNFILLHGEQALRLFPSGIEYYLGARGAVQMDKNRHSVSAFHFHHWHPVSLKMNNRVYAVKNIVLCSDFYHEIIDLYNLQQQYLSYIKYMMFKESKRNEEEEIIGGGIPVRIVSSSVRPTKPYHQMLVYGGPQLILNGYMPEWQVSVDSFAAYRERCLMRAASLDPLDLELHQAMAESR